MLTIVIACAAARAGAQAVTAAPTGIAAHHALALRLAELVNDAALMRVAMGLDDSTGNAMQRALVSATVSHMAKYAPRDSVVAITAREYERRLSEQDLRDVLAFYSSPGGERYKAAQPGIAAAIREGVNRLLQPHQAELQEAVMKLMSP